MPSLAPVPPVPIEARPEPPAPLPVGLRATRSPRRIQPHKVFKQIPTWSRFDRLVGSRQ